MFFTEPAVASLVYRATEGVEHHRAAGRLAKEHYEKTGVIDPIRAYHTTDQTAANVALWNTTWN